MNTKQSIGMVLIILSILLLVGTIYQFIVVTNNENTYEERKALLGFLYTDSEDGKNDRETIDSQWEMVGWCGVSFFILLIIGIALFISGADKYPKQYIPQRPSRRPPRSPQGRPTRRPPRSPQGRPTRTPIHPPSHFHREEKEQKLININIGKIGDESRSTNIGEGAIVQRSNIGAEKSEPISICPYCGKDLNFPKTPNFCPYCKERLI